jgi:O-antigen/teichoic acid export membrane protein
MNFFISKFFGFTYLGLYNRSSSFSEEIFNQFSNITWKVGFPLYSKAKNDNNLINTVYENSLKLLTILVYPLTFLIYFSSSYFVDLLFDKEWILMSILIKLFCLLGLMTVLLIPTGILLQSIGKPKIATKLNLYLNLFTIIIIYPLSSTYGIEGVIYSLILSVLFIYPFHYYELKKLINFNFLFRTISPPLISSVLMLLCMNLLVKFIIISSILKLFAIIFLGGLIYLILIFLFEKYLKLGLLNIIKN